MADTLIPRPAATLVLLRPESDGFSVLLMKRPSRSSFMGGMHVFPGGKVESTDQPAEPTPFGAELAKRMQLSPLECEAFVQAACRETYEEMGIVLASGNLVYFDHWITPVIEPKRFDTRFFAAKVAPDITPVPNQEAISCGFFRPAEALSMIAAGEMAMAPPTLITMQRLAKHATVDDALSALSARAVAPLQPELASGEPITLVLPGHPAHPVKDRREDNPLFFEMQDGGRWRVVW